MRCTFFCCLLSLSFLTHAQPKTLSVDHLTVENGLPENYATDIVQDAKGYMWIGTQLGLVRYDGYRIKVYKEELDKVKSGFHGVTALFIDSHKTLWVGTALQGLLKYDPLKDTFTTYPYKTSKNDTLNYVRKIVEDGRGNLWLRSFNIRKRTWVLFQFSQATGRFTGFGSDNRNGVGASRLYDAISDKGGNIWAMTNNGIYKFDAGSNKFIGYLTSSDPKKQKIIEIIYEPPSEPGIFYLDVADSTGDHGMIRFNTKNNSSVTFSHSNADAKSIANDTVTAIKEDNAHRLWVGTEAGLSMFNRFSGNFKNYTAKDSSASGGISIIQDDVAGFMWLYSSRGFLSFNPATGAFITYPLDINREDGLSTTAIQKIFRDTTGSIWLTTRNFGVERINKNKSEFTVVKNIPDKPGSYNSGRVVKIVEDPDHTFWLGTANGLCHYDPVNNSFKNIPLSSQPISAAGVGAIVLGSDGLIWRSVVNKGIACYNPHSGITKSYNVVKNDTTSLSDSVVTQIYQDRNGTIWVGTRWGGLCRFNKGKENFTRYPFIINQNHSYSGKSLDDRTVGSIFEDSKGRFWVGTNLGGLNLMDRAKGTFTSYQDLQKGLGCIDGITEDNQGRLWLASYIGGVSIFDPATGNTRRFTEKNGLLCDASTAISEDAEGNVWVSSQRGFSFINTKTLAIKNFTKAQGLPDNNFATSIFCNSSGELMAGFKLGLVIFSPSVAKPNNVIPITNIESVNFTVSSKEGERDSAIIISGQQKIEFKHDENRLTFHYVGLQYENAALNKYRYKLEGYDKDWKEAGTLRAATYTNLSPGTYTFYVKSANSDGVWNEKAESIKVIIHSPWWRTWWAYLIYAILFVAALRAYIVFRSKSLLRHNRILEEKVNHRTHQLSEANEELKTTQEEIVAQRDKLAQAVTTLQATQSQLIQSEKMASLGELTAGIAHEIQNPLNFVNNFSEVSTELVDEMEDALQKNDKEEAIAISSDIKDNLQKIHHHGKRADAIVKGMLQHSRASTGKKEPTDINALAVEYLRLAYHGLRAKDKAFNASFKTELDSTIGEMSIVPEDIGRVLLNLYNNAFYAVNEKKKALNGTFEPMVEVSTKRVGDKIELSVRDNGTGIPQKVLDKIYQPFFTTKPTGQGTGLGLSLSYDIIKAHRGELQVNTREGEGAEFIISIPMGKFC